MSREHLMGVSLDTLQDPIIEALARYQETSDGLVINGVDASKLVLTPDKPNSARTATNVSFQGNKIGTLYTVAFKPKDGTGSEVSHELKDLIIEGEYPRDIKVIPRGKAGVHQEAHLAVVTHKIEDVHAEPILFGGEFDLLGLKDGRVLKIGRLGSTETHQPQHTATLTVGFSEGKRFGDPHAVYSSMPNTIQVCAFLAVSDEVHAKHPNILQDLTPQLPFVN